MQVQVPMDVQKFEDGERKGSVRQESFLPLAKECHDSGVDEESSRVGAGRTCEDFN